jgi:hypothetical protein
MPTDTPLNRGGNKYNGQRASIVIIPNTITKNNILKQRTEKYANQQLVPLMLVSSVGYWLPIWHSPINGLQSKNSKADAIVAIIRSP